MSSRSQESDYLGELRPVVSTAPHENDVIVERAAYRRNISKSTVSPMSGSLSFMGDLEEDDDVDEYGFPIIKSPSEDEDLESVAEERRIKDVGLKWRVRVVRVLDSDEQWNGVCEIFFHWNSSDTNNGGARRRKNLTNDEKIAIVSMEKPDKCPNFTILNEEDSKCIEEMYYTMPGFPGISFAYLAWSVVVHERLELERYPFDRQFFKLELECTNGVIVPWKFQPIPSLVRGRLELGNVLCNFFGVSDTPSWKLDVLKVVKGNRESVLHMNVGMTRLTGFYISNVALPYFLIGTASLLTVAIEPEDYGTRFECMIALYLTLVAIKFVASFLPVISYSTLLDYYTLTAYFFLATWMLENFMVSPLIIPHDRDTAKKIDHAFASVYLILWIFLHVAIILGSSYDFFRKTWEEVEDDDQDVDPDTHKEIFDIESKKKRV